MITYLEGGFPLRCFQRLSRPYIATLLHRWHDDRSTRGMFTPVLSRSEEHTSELQSLMRISYAVFCLKKKTPHKKTQHTLLQDIIENPLHTKTSQPTLCMIPTIHTTN